MSGPRRFVITVDGRRLDVAVQPTEGDGPVEVIVDGQPRWVSRAAGGVALVRGPQPGPQVRVSLPDGPKPDWAGTTAKTHELLVRTARQAAHDDAEAAAEGGASGTARIEAPMPGRVVKVMVADGDVVDANAPLMIIEAMKMENEVRAPSGGAVRGIAVEAGATVEPGQVLCVIEAEADDEASDADG